MAPTSSRGGPVLTYRGYSKLRTHTALGPYGRSIRRSIGPSLGRCVSKISSNPRSWPKASQIDRPERLRFLLLGVCVRERERERERESERDSEREQSSTRCVFCGPTRLNMQVRSVKKSSTSPNSGQLVGVRSSKYTPADPQNTSFSTEPFLINNLIKTISFDLDEEPLYAPARQGLKGV